MKKIFKIIDEISKLRKEKVYVVGGYIRDLFFKRKTYDIDFVVFGDGISFAKEFSKKVSGFFRVLKEKFSAARVIVTSRKRTFQFDFTKNRGHSLYSDSKKRDFTINILLYPVSNLYPIKKEKVIDPLNGINDIKRRCLKEVSKKIFHDDPVRIIRAFRFAGMFNLSFSNSLEELIKKEKNYLKNATIERLKEEWFKILGLPNAYEVVCNIDKFDIFKFFIPEIIKMKGVEQSLYHHLDVWQHSLETLKMIERIGRYITFLPEEIRKKVKEYLSTYVIKNHSTKAILLKFAALLHDIAKPDVKREEEKKITFYGHDTLGAIYAKRILQRLKLSNKEIETICIIIKNHLRPGFLWNNDTPPTKRAIFRLFRDAKEDVVGVIIFSLADRLAARGEKVTKEIIQKHKNAVSFLLNYYFNEYLSIKPIRLISGNDIMERFNLKPGPIIGKLLAEVEEAQLEKIVLTKEDALSYVGKILENLK